MLLLIGKLGLLPSILDIDSESLGREEAEPLNGLMVHANLSERIVPIGQAKVHDHQPEVVSKSIGDEEPTSRQVLEPYLWLCIIVFVDHGKAPIPRFSIDVESSNHTCSLTTFEKNKKINETLW